MGQHGPICANKGQYGSIRTSGRSPKLFVYSSPQNSRSHPYAAESTLGCFKVALVIIILIHNCEKCPELSIIMLIEFLEFGPVIILFFMVFVACFTF